MFPQSELDNYKLQVELLQEKLQRSEISRQHLEHKLDKILHKRDEHDKVVRSKAKQKYQQFLEEQHRRNERNKQLVQMLERIEHQTEAMNARSERLKMMKMQYEMYFAKLVHSQTRRCIQSSVPSNVTPMMPTTFSRSIQQTMMPTQQAQPDIRMEGYNYTNTMDPQLMTTAYQRYPIPNMENEQFFKPQSNNPTLQNLEMSTSNFAKPERNDYMDFININNSSSNQNQEQYLYQPIPTLRDFVQTQPDNSYARMESDPKLYTSSPIANEHKSHPTTTSLLSKDKQTAELDKASTTSTTSSLTFDRIPNINMKPQLSNNFTESSNSEILLNNKNNEIRLKPNNATNNLIASPQETSSDVNLSSLISQELKEIQDKVDTNVNEMKPLEITEPVILDKKSKSYEIEKLKPVEQIAKTSVNELKTDVNISAKTTIPTEQAILPNTIPNNTLDKNSTTTPVSIENIENAIYGELLTPIATADVHHPQENSNVAPKLLENLVTQPENLELEHIPLAESKTDLQQYVPDTISTNFDSANTGNDYEPQPDEQNHDQTLAYDYNNTQQSEATENNANEYPVYENVDNTAVDESQQEQQYDYSNYDPSQYSYPGYIYDETTGEYKPDPNAPSEQYATDQQYAAEGYDQQQYQQQEGYDYNQYEAQDQSSTNVDNTNYENYDTTQQENDSNSTQLDDNTQSQAQAEPATTTTIEPLPESVPVEEVAQTPAITTKPTSILSTAEKNEAQKKKKRVNFVDSSETDESVADKVAVPALKSTSGNAAASSESDFDFSSSTETATKPT